MEDKGHGEIVIRVTARNLERMIYILIIIGLIIFSVVEFNKDSSNCPKVECSADVASTPSEITVATETVKEAPKEEVKTTTTKTTTPTIAKPKLSGDVDFLLNGVTTCLSDQSTDLAKFKSIDLSIYNGLDRMFTGNIKLYIWNDEDLFSNDDYVTEIKGIKVMSGAKMERSYPVNSGFFKDVDNKKRVKAILIDADLDKQAGDANIKSGIKATISC